MTDTGIYATSARPGPDHYRYALACIEQGMSPAAAARAAGVNELDLRALCRNSPRRQPAPPPPPVEVVDLPPLVRASGAISDSTPEECAQIAALAIATVHERSGLNVARITVANIMNSIPSLVPTDVVPARRTIARDVAEYVARMHNLTFADLCSARRTNTYARPRQIAMYAIRQLCQHMSYPAIGRLFGGRDHTTVMHGERTVARLIQSNPDIAETVAKVLTAFTPSEAA